MRLQAPVSDETLVNDILKGLGSEYRPFVRAIEARNVPIMMMFMLCC